LRRTHLLVLVANRRGALLHEEDTIDRTFSRSLIKKLTMSRNVRRLPGEWPLKKVLLGLGARRGRKGELA
jgi:hypothetical protein